MLCTINAVIDIIKSNYDNTLANTTIVTADVLHLLFTNSAANKMRQFTQLV